MIGTGKNDEKRSGPTASGGGSARGVRTDLACEAGPGPRRCVTVRRTVGSAGGAGRAAVGHPVTVTRSREADGRRFVTLHCGTLTGWSEEELTPLSSLLACELRSMAAELTGRPAGPSLRVLVAGLGNADMTPDALGPGTVRRLTVTRHLKAHDGALFGALGCCELSAVAPGVLGQTGIEASELVREAAGTVQPHLVVAVDALAARRCERLVSTVQLSDGGLSPGSGIGNRRTPIDRETVGCPVLALGIPTVVDSATLVLDALERAGLLSGGDDGAESSGEGVTGSSGGEASQDAFAAVLDEGRRFIVSPRDCDRMIALSCMLLARALDTAFGVEGV